MQSLKDLAGFNPEGLIPGRAPEEPAAPAAEPPTITYATALVRVFKGVRADPAIAWEWHSPIAIAAEFAGATEQLAHEGAARYMQRTFGVDTRSHPDFVAMTARWAEARRLLGAGQASVNNAVAHAAGTGWSMPILMCHDQQKPIGIVWIEGSDLVAAFRDDFEITLDMVLAIFPGGVEVLQSTNHADAGFLVHKVRILGFSLTSEDACKQLATSAGWGIHRDPDGNGILPNDGGVTAARLRNGRECPIAHLFAGGTWDRVQPDFGAEIVAYRCD